MCVIFNISSTLIFYPSNEHLSLIVCICIISDRGQVILKTTMEENVLTQLQS